MDNTIIDVVIGLVLIYATFALLVTSLQEVLSGTVMRDRARILHRLLWEAVGQNDELHRKILKNPLVFALSEGKASEPGKFFASGPSAIPADVFARALLMEVNNGVHPTEQFATPQQFVAAFADVKPERPREIDATLRALVVGRETDWRAYEAAIAEWFNYVGDRSEGWYRRHSAYWTFGLALGLAAALNIDSFHIARALSENGELRTGIVELAERLVVERNGNSLPISGAYDAKISTPDRPEVIASARLVDAYNSLRVAYFKDAEIARFRHDLFNVSKNCTLLTNDQKATGISRLNSEYLSNAKVWMDILPGILPYIETAVAGYVPESQKGKEEGIADNLRRAHACLTHISAWVRAAATASDKLETRRLMQDAAVALQDSKAALVSLMSRHQVSHDLKRLFHVAPDVFNECATAVEVGQGSFRDCVRESSQGLSRLPIGYTPNNLNIQFCTVQVAEPGKALASLDYRATSLCDARQEARPGLGLPAMVLVEKQGWAPYIIWFGGVLCTVFFAMLGAPFWFDLLSHFVKFRAAGRTRENQNNARIGAGTRALPAVMLDKTVASSVPGGREAVAGAPQPPFSAATNRFEDLLVTREIIALQQALGVKPETGVLDAATRIAIRRRQQEMGIGDLDSLTGISYQQIVGRPPIGSKVATPTLTIRPQLRQPYAHASPVAKNLMSKLGFEGRILDTERAFSDDIRALAVLYQYKTDPATPVCSRRVFKLAKEYPSVLDSIDETLINSILDSSGAKFPRESAPWLDWAIGELGQVEANASSRRASNPRICEYLDSVEKNLGDSGDTTPWCGAFVHWVVIRHNSLLPEGAPPLQDSPQKPALAESWENWGVARTLDIAEPGDIIVVKTADTKSARHVGFCFSIEKDTVWMLGGNQAKGSRVCLTTFPVADVISIRRGV